MEAATELTCILQGKPSLTSYVDVKVQDDDKFVPITKKTVCYIVCGILFNDDGEVLMMQEAKKSCYGLWYLPAGRMELNETIEEAVQREVLEETGIEFQPTSLLSVEVSSGFWYRFTLTGHVTGGSLKTTAQQDKESLQAKWCSVELIKSGRKGFPLRASDILPLIDLAVKCRNSPSPSVTLMPVVKPHTKLLLRVVFIHTDTDRSEMNLLLCKEPHPHLPVGIISTSDVSLQVTIHRMIQAILGHVKVQSKLVGVLAVEHCGKPAKANDGLCISLLVTLVPKNNILPDPYSSKYEWCCIDGEIAKTVTDKCQPGSLVPLYLLR